MPLPKPTPFAPLAQAARQRSMRRFGLEALEPRWLLSATPLAAALSTIWPEVDAAPLAAQTQVHAPQGDRQVATSAVFDLAAAVDVPGALWASLGSNQSLASGDLALLAAQSSEALASERWLFLRQ